VSLNWYLRTLKKYAVYDGRACRKEYWYFFLFNILIIIGLTFIDYAIGTLNPKGHGLLSTIYTLAVAIPTIAVSVRRLHDRGKSGWWFLINLVPLAGPLVFLVFMVPAGQPGANEFGPNPNI
jgi:uncharacterized membrane protein YhaH (DUF805 family)